MPAAKPRGSRSKVELPPRASYSQLTLFQRCKTAYYWRYGLGLERAAPFIGLFRGTLLHQAYDKYLFGDREDHSLAHNEVDRLAQEALDKNMDAEIVNSAADEAHEVLSHYLPWADINDDWRVVVLQGATQCEVNGVIEIDIPGTKVKKPFVFKIDALVERDGQLMMLENKFRKNLDASGLEHDLQILAYQAAWNLLHPEHKLTGVIYNIVAAKPRKTDGAVGTREYFYRGATEEKVAINLIRSVMMEMQSQTKLGVWPMNPRKECSWDCDFVGMCLGVRAGATVQEYVESGEYRVGDRHAQRFAETSD